MYGLTRLPHRGLSLLGDFDSLFYGFITPTRHSDDSDSGFTPPLDIVETAAGHKVTVDLPGVKKEDLAVNIKENVLTIEAETRAEREHKEDGEVIKSERRIGKYYRALRLGDAVDEAKIRAEYNDGVLKLTLPRSPKVEAKKVEVKVH